MKTASSETKARLAFSVTRHIKTGIFLMDEGMTVLPEYLESKTG